MKSCLIIAGEKSGEEHAMSFFPELRRLLPETKFYGVGGELLKKEGMELIYHLGEFSSMGFSEVIGKIPFYFRALNKFETLAQERETKTAILIDFQDFNLRLAQRLSKQGVRVLYYVAPQAWVWKAKRAGVLSRTVHTLFSILPFEKDWFEERGVKQIRSVPHPLRETHAKDLAALPEKNWQEMRKKKIKILLLPGSRRFEVELLLPRFIEAIRNLKKDFVIETHLVRVSHLSPNLYDYFGNEIDHIYDSEELTQAMKTCHLALAASGTVTLSTGLFELPTVVAYRASLLNEFVFRNFIKYEGAVSLTNIIHGKMLFPELIQDEASPARLERALRTWIEDEKAYNHIKRDLKETKVLLSGEEFSVPKYMAKVIHEN
jgi:lipid-A-disaccharide synthase